MQNMKTLPDNTLLSQIQTLAAEERKITTKVLELLKEVDRRRLYAREGHATLFEYVVKGLGYSEASAARRINSMRLLKELPDIATSIEAGRLNLSSVATVQTFLKREKREKGKTYSTDEKRELLQKMEHRSHRECEKILFQVSPESARSKEKARVISPSEMELRFVASEELMKKLEQIKGLLAHSHPNLGMAKLIEILADRTLDQIDPIRKENRTQAKAMTKAVKSREKHEPQVETEPKPSGAIAATSPTTPTSEPHRRPASPRFIPAQVRRQVWARDGGQCSYTSPTTGKRCESRFGLEIDHRTAVALGGGSDVSQLRLLCKSHNVWEAINQLGHAKMAQFIPRLR
jgi:hypothetical protein